MLGSDRILQRGTSSNAFDCLVGMTMRRLILILCSSCIVTAALLVPCHRVVAEDTEIPPVVLAGFSAYQSDGVDAAFKAWLAGSPVEGEKTALSEANSFRQVESLYGKYQGFDLIKIITPAPRTKFVYVQMNFEKGPLFTNFRCYQEEHGWIIPMLTFNTEAEKVIPAEVLYTGNGATSKTSEE